ncbi:MAG: polyprenyl synthetase family protein, partial [Bacteroidota bacterium]
CAACVAAVTQDEKLIKAAHQFGTLTGIAFQIKDDLFDFGSEGDIGKPTGIDIKEKKMTLPLIYALNQSTWNEKRKIINLIKNHNEESEQVKKVIDFVIQKGGITYANKIMHDYKDQALLTLQQLPENESRNSLQRLLTYAIERKK